MVVEPRFLRPEYAQSVRARTTGDDSVFSKDPDGATLLHHLLFYLTFLRADYTLSKATAWPRAAVAVDRPAGFEGICGVSYSPFTHGF